MQHNAPDHGVLHGHIAKHQAHGEGVHALTQVTVEEAEEKRGNENCGHLAVLFQVSQQETPEDQLFADGGNDPDSQQHEHIVAAKQRF